MSRRKRVIDTMEKNQSMMVDLAQWIYEHPEIGLEEFETSAHLCEVLRANGFEVEDKIEGMETAFRATKKNGTGPKIGIVAEYDALPGAGHACGHHLIASMSVAAALGLSSLLDDLKGEVVVLGTPSEETGDGKPFMIEKGYFEGIDVALMVHPNNKTAIYADWIAIGGIDFSFKGFPAHAGAAPHMGINALDAVVLFYNNINALRQQIKDGTRIHGIILEAGSAANIIPDSGRVRMEFRAKEQEYFDEVVVKAINCAKAAALATGCELEYHHFEPTCQGVLHNVALSEHFRKELEVLGIYDDGEYFTGSTDMGNVSQIIPAIHPLVKMVLSDANIHTQEFKADTCTAYAHENMHKAALAMALTGLKAWEDKAFLEKAWTEIKK